MSPHAYVECLEIEIKGKCVTFLRMAISSPLPCNKSLPIIKIVVARFVIFIQKIGEKSSTFINILNTFH